MKKDKNSKTSLNQEEFGYDLSPDDLDVAGQNQSAKKSSNNATRAKQANKNNSSKSNN